MISVLVPTPLLWGAGIFTLISIAGSFFYVYKFQKKNTDFENTDKVILIDKTNRWEILNTDLTGCSKYQYKNKMYFLNDNATILNKKGKSLCVFSVNNPNPMEIKYKSNKWMSSESLMSTINNEILKKMLNPNSISDNLLLFGALGGIIAALVSIINLAKTFGLF